MRSRGSAMTYPAIPAFVSVALSPLELGADALLYVMDHGHAIGVPTDALYFAEKVAIVSIARRETDPIILRKVNTAIDVICLALRHRTALDAAAATPVPAVEPSTPDV